MKIKKINDPGAQANSARRISPTQRVGVCDGSPVGCGALFGVGAGGGGVPRRAQLVATHQHSVGV